jgi:AcrR family transcriptional regulator
MMNWPASAPASDVGDPALWAKVENASARAILTAALVSFSEDGYHATTTRRISERAGLSPTAMYVHYRSKMDLLVLLCEIGHAAVLEEVEAALAEGGDPADKIRRFVCVFVAWHARNHTLGRVVQYEMHTIPKERFEAIRDLRERTTRRLREVLDAGAAQSVFTIGDPLVTTISILSIGIDVARWYNGRPEPEALAAAQSELVMSMIGAPAGS